MTRWIAVLILSTLPMSAAHAADIGVSPPRIDLTVPAGGTASTTFNVIWTGKDAVRLDLSKADWTMGQDGGLTYMVAGDGTYSAASWLNLQSDGVDLPGAGQQAVRLAVQVPPNTALAGTYNAVIFVETPTAPATGTGTHLLMRQRVGVVVYVTIAGTEKNGSKLTDMYSDGSTVHAIVANQGNTVMRYSGSLEVRDASGNTIKSLSFGSSAILRESERDISVAVPELPKGYYVLLLLLKDSRGGLLTGQLPYEVQ